MLGLENEDNRDIGKYEGEIKYGFPNSQGTFTLNDGEMYVGKFKDREEWNGKQYDKEWRTIIGKWFDGVGKAPEALDLKH